MSRLINRSLISAAKPASFKRAALLALAASVLGLAIPAQAGVLLQYTFTSNTAPDTVGANVDATHSTLPTGDLNGYTLSGTGGVSTATGYNMVYSGHPNPNPDSSGGPGISDPSYAFLPGSTGATGYTNSAQAIAALSYIRFSVSATAGNSLNLTSLVGDWAAGNSDYARGYAIYASTDGLNYTGYATKSDSPDPLNNTPAVDVTITAGHNYTVDAELDTTNLAGLSGPTIYFEIPVWNSSNVANGRDVLRRQPDPQRHRQRRPRTRLPVPPGPQRRRPPPPPQKVNPRPARPAGTYPHNNAGGGPKWPPPFFFRDPFLF